MSAGCDVKVTGYVCNRNTVNHPWQLHSSDIAMEEQLPLSNLMLETQVWPPHFLGEHFKWKYAPETAILINMRLKSKTTKDKIGGISKLRVSLIHFGEYRALQGGKGGRV